jgi:hypothetical protein
VIADRRVNTGRPGAVADHPPGEDSNCGEQEDGAAHASNSARIRRMREVTVLTMTRGRNCGRTWNLLRTRGRRPLVRLRCRPGVRRTASGRPRHRSLLSPAKWRQRPRGDARKPNQGPSDAPRRRLLCEDCIVREVRLTDLSNVRTMIDAIGIDAIGAAKGFRHATGLCRVGGREREGLVAG